MAAFEAMTPPSPALFHVLLGKSIVETLLVGSLALFAFINVVPPYFHGWGEVTANGISGWAVNNAEPWQRVEIQLYIDGKFVAHAVAAESRPDVLAAGWSKDEWHGYSFSVDQLPVGYHEARVYALHQSKDGIRKSLQLLGNSIPFFVDADRKIFSPSK